jgi:hypothetical protein
MYHMLAAFKHCLSCCDLPRLQVGAVDPEYDDQDEAAGQPPAQGAYGYPPQQQQYAPSGYPQQQQGGYPLQHKKKGFFSKLFS